MRKIVVITLLFLLFVPATWARISNATRKLLKKATVVVLVYDPDSENLKSYGSGFLAKNGQGDVRIYTAYHVISEASNSDWIVIGFWNDETNDVDYKLIVQPAACDTEIDIACLEIVYEINRNSLRGRNRISKDEIEEKYGNCCLRLELDKKPEELEDVVIAGYPWRQLDRPCYQLCEGQVSGYDRGYMLVAPTLPFDHGQSGGPILHKDGMKVVGIATAMTSETARGANLAVPSMEMRDLWENEEHYANNCVSASNYSTERSSGKTPVTGKVIDEETEEPLEGIGILILDGDYDWDEEISEDDLLAIGKSDEFGKFKCIPALDYPQRLTVVAIDTTKTYEIFIDRFTHGPGELRIRMSRSSTRSSGKTPVTGKVIDKETEKPLEGIGILILDGDYDLDEEISKDDVLAIGESDEFGKFKCIPALDYPQRLTVVAVDTTETYEIFAAKFTHDPGELEIRMSRSSTNNNTFGYERELQGPIRYDTGDPIKIGVIAIFEDEYDVYTYVLLLGNEEASEEFITEKGIGTGMVRDGKYYIKIEPGVKKGALLVLDIYLDKMSMVPNVRFRDGETIVVPW